MNAKTKELWFVVPRTIEEERWDVAYRIRYNKPSRRFTFCELRIYPHSKGYAEMPGEWPGSFEPELPTRVPVGGVPPALVRLPIKRHAQEAAKQLREQRSTLRVDSILPPMLPSPPPRKPGRPKSNKPPEMKKQDLRTLLWLCSLVDAEIAAGNTQNPVTSVALKHTRYKPDTARHYMTKARAEGIAPKRIADGGLTKYGHQLWNEMRRKEGKA